MTLEEMNEEELWNQYWKAHDEWAKADKELIEFISALKPGTYWTVEKTECLRRLEERIRKANEKGASVIRALRKLKGY